MGDACPTVFPRSHCLGHPTEQRGNVQKGEGAAQEGPAEKESNMTKYGVYAYLTTGVNLFSTHRSEKAARRVAAARKAEGFPCIVLPVNK